MVSGGAAVNMTFVWLIAMVVFLAVEAVIRAPVPKEVIKNAFSGLEADVYKTTGAAELRSGPHEPESITYTAWSAGTTYAVGAKVTYSGQNYELTAALDGDERYTQPSVLTNKWTKIANRTSGDPVLVKLKSGTQLYYVSGPTDGWYKMMTTYGLEGYIKSTQVEYWKHLTPSETKDRVITEQLFRIKSVEVDSDAGTVTVNAQHVSYDLNGVLIDKVSIKRKQLPYALAMLEDAWMIPYEGTVATNITSDNDTDYSAEISGKSAMYAIMDPDAGLVRTFDAALQRDNWDLFIMAKTNEDRGFRIRYGNNMKGVHWKRSTENLVTRVVPVAKDANGADFYLSGTKWVDSSRIGNYPKIRMEWLKVAGQVGKDDGTETATNWTEAALRSEMTKKAQARFKKDKADRAVHEITVEFEMLGDTPEYAFLKQLQELVLYDTVIVIDEKIGLSVTVTVDELEYDIVKKKIIALKLTNVKAYNVKNVGGYNVLNNSISGDKLTADAGDELVTQAAEEAVATSAAYTQSRISSYDTTIKAWIAENYVPLEE